MDSQYCPICGNRLPENSPVCIHCATPIDRPDPAKPRAGCLSAFVLMAALSLTAASLAGALLGKLF